MTLYSWFCSLVVFLAPPVLVSLWLWDGERRYWQGFDEGRAVGFSLGRMTNDDDTHNKRNALTGK